MNYRKTEKKKSIMIILLAVAVLVILATALVVHASGSGRGYRTISVVEVSGSVSVVKGNIEYTAYPGMLLQEGHEIITAGNSYVRMVLDEDKYIKLESGSRLVFETLGMLGSGKTGLKLERGAITTELVSPLDVEEEYVINTPNAVLAVRGTFFRVDLNATSSGEIVADVMTYGGCVASKRILPTGDVVEEDVLIDAGYKTRINMNAEDTVYIVDETELAVDTSGNGIVDVEPIQVQTIPDHDLIDVYFAAENGHELFVTAEEIKTDIEARNINLEEQVSVYEKAQQVKSAETVQSTEKNTTSVTVLANDSRPLARVEEIPDEKKEVATNRQEGVNQNRVSLVDGDRWDNTSQETEEPVEEELVTEEPEIEEPEVEELEIEEPTVEEPELEEPEAEEPEVIVPETGTAPPPQVPPPQVPEVHVHSYGEEQTQAPTCTAAGVLTYSCNCGHHYTEEIAATGHTEVPGGTEEAHAKCSVCDTALSTEHSYADNVTVEPTCTTVGVMSHVCDCGYVYTTPIDIIAHEVMDGGTAEAHSMCAVCDLILSTEHSYEDTVTLQATCTKTGETTHSCECGYSYTTLIPATGHTEVKGGTIDVHSKCSVCDTTLSMSHSCIDNVTVTPTCTMAGVMTHVCECGYEYTSPIDMIAHEEEDGGVEEAHSKCSVCGTITDAEHAYTEAVTRAATCTAEGEMTHSCDCGYSYTTTIALTDHIEVNGGTEDVHTKCYACQATLSTAHSYTDSVTTQPTCTAEGETTHSCSCGYSYTTPLDATGHTEVAGGTESAHTKCSVCQEPLSSTHSYTESVISGATCRSTGTMKHSCDCGYYYTSTIPIADHEKAEQDESVTTCIYCYEKWVDLDSTNFPDSKFRTFVAQYDTDNSGYLLGDEMSSLRNLNINGTESADGGYTDLTGVEHFPFLATVNCSYNAGITSLDLSGCTSVYDLNCSNTGVNSIHLEGTSIQTLNLSGVPMTSFNSITMPATPAIFALHISGTNFNFQESGIDTSWLGTVGLFEANNAGINNADWAVIKAKLPNTVDYLQLADNDLTGEFNASGYTQLRMLSLKGTNGVTSLVLPQNPALMELDISGTQLSTLDVSGCTTLNYIWASGCTALTDVNVSGCSMLTALNISGCTALVNLNASGTGINYMEAIDLVNLQSMDLSNCTSLYNFYMDDREKSYALASLNVSGCTNLGSLEVSNCANLVDLDITGTDNLARINIVGSTMLTGILDLSGRTTLTSVGICECTALTGVNLSGCTSLSNLSLSGCVQVATLDITNAMGLGYVDIQNCYGLTGTLDISQRSSLFTLMIGGCSGITGLNVSGNTTMSTLLCHDTDISSLDLSTNTALQTLVISGCSGITSMSDITVSSMAQITRFELSNTDIDFTETGIDLSWFASLTAFAAENAGIGDADWEVLKEALPATLTELELSQNQVTSLDLSKFTQLSTLGVRNNSSMTTLNISNTKVGTLNLTNCTSLTSIDVMGVTSSTGSIEVVITGTSLTESDFTTDGTLTVTLVTT